MWEKGKGSDPTFWKHVACPSQCMLLRKPLVGKWKCWDEQLFTLSLETNLDRFTY